MSSPNKINTKALPSPIRGPKSNFPTFISKMSLCRCLVESRSKSTQHLIMKAHQSFILTVILFLLIFPWTWVFSIGRLAFRVGAVASWWFLTCFPRSLHVRFPGCIGFDCVFREMPDEALVTSTHQGGARFSGAFCQTLSHPPRVVT